MNKNDCVEWGYVMRTHRLVGELRISIDDTLQLVGEQPELVLIEMKQKLIPFFVSTYTSQANGKQAIIAFEDLKTIEAAQALKGSKLFLPKAAIAASDDALSMLIGYTLIDHEKGEIGKVTEVYSTEPQAIISVEVKGCEVLIPYVKGAIITKVEHSKQQVFCQLPEGLIEVYLTND